MFFLFPTLNDQFWVILLNGAIILKGYFCLRHQNATKLPHFLTLFYSSRLEKKWFETKTICNYGDFWLLLALRITLKSHLKMLFFKYHWKTMSVWIRSGSHLRHLYYHDHFSTLRATKLDTGENWDSQANPIVHGFLLYIFLIWWTQLSLFISLLSRSSGSRVWQLNILTLPESYSFSFIKRQSLKASGSGRYKHYTTDIKVRQLRKHLRGYCNWFVTKRIKYSYCIAENEVTFICIILQLFRWRDAIGYLREITLEFSLTSLLSKSVSKQSLSCF